MLKQPPVLICVIFLLALFSCRKEQTLQNAEGKRLFKIINRSMDSVSYTLYRYDAANRLNGRIDSNNSRHAWFGSFLYNNEGKVFLSISHYEYDRVPVQVLVIDTFVYNKEGRIFRKFSYQPSLLTYVLSHSFSYDLKGRLIADSVFNLNMPASLFGYSSYTYDANDNVVRVEEYNASSGSIKLERISRITYDNHPNPYYEIPMLYYLSDGYGYYYLGRNNRTRVTDSSEAVDFHYQYQANGLPKRADEMDQANPSSGYTEFFYQ